MSIKENDKFWAKEGKRITWMKKYTKIKDVKYSKDEVKIKWYYDGTLNASVNCIDRHLKKNPTKTAIIWVGDDPADTKKISYKENLVQRKFGTNQIQFQVSDLQFQLNIEELFDKLWPNMRQIVRQTQMRAKTGEWVPIPV